MIIGACGYGSTGSSVLTDLLREYEDVQVYDSFEFVLPYIADGLEDLEYHLMKQYAKGESSDIAIRRFLKRVRWFYTPFINKPCEGKLIQRYSEEYIDEITQLKFKGVYTADICTGNILHNICAFGFKKIVIPRVFERLMGRPVYSWPCHKIYYSIEPDIFYDATKRYINKILIAMGADLEKPIALDQPFSGNNPEDSFPFFEEPYAVVIDRDPRDVFLEGEYSRDPDDKFFPRGSASDFVTYYRSLRKHGLDTNKNILKVSFESFVYEYDATINKIEEFLHLSKHIYPKKHFDPAASINNTQKWRLYPEQAENIRYIENELREFLFPFEMYPKVDFTSSGFTGASRKALNVK